MRVWVRDGSDLLALAGGRALAPHAPAEKPAWGCGLNLGSRISNLQAQADVHEVIW